MIYSKGSVMYRDFNVVIQDPINEDFTSWTNKQLYYFEILLSKTMLEVGMYAPESEKLIYAYNIVHEEMQKRGKVKMPSRGL